MGGWLKLVSCGLNKLRCNYCTWHQADLDFSLHYIILGQLAWTRPGESAWVAGGSWGTVDGRGMADLSCLSLGLRGNEVADKWLAPSFTHNHPFPRLSGLAWYKFLFLGRESCGVVHCLRRAAPRASGKHQAPKWPEHQPTFSSDYCTTCSSPLTTLLDIVPLDNPMSVHHWSINTSLSLNNLPINPFLVHNQCIISPQSVHWIIH